MSQKLIQSQEQKAVQVQRLTQQQMLAVKMLEMPLTELEQSVQAEIDDNPAMESSAPEDAVFDEQQSEQDDFQDSTESSSGKDSADETDRAEEAFNAETEKEERESALDDALSNIGMDDRMPETNASSAYNPTDNADYEEIVYGEQTSFYDKLKEQMVDVDLTEKEQQIMEYIIGSLDNDGLLRKTADSICDELAIYHNVDCTEEDIKRLIGILQSFDPAGIGAENLKECLLLQIDRKAPSKTRDLMHEVIDKHFDEFMNKHWDKIAKQMALSPSTADNIHAELLRLNPKPGASLGETEGRNMQQITPDFIVDTADDGTVTFYINNGHIPNLYISPSFSELIKGYKENKASMTKRDKEALLYAKEKVDRAQGFIDAVKQRQHTLYVTMKAIIDIQKRFFQDGDESDIKPMILKDISDRTGLDKSTISRVSNMKYAQTRWGTFKLRHFFSDGIKTEDGEELSTRKIKLALKELIENEDKKKPLSDDALTKHMQQKGYPIARRTIAKYREQLGIPVARLRKK